jgi:aspartyl/asparaginyl beta-hydroxylase (cupin superfamily)
MRFLWAAAFDRGVAALILNAAASPNDVWDRTGFLNPIFKYVYASRRVARRIKA